MALTNQKAQFLGIDISGIAHAVQHFWHSLMGMPPFSWLSPKVVVRVTLAGGGESCWLAGDHHDAISPTQARKARFSAVEVPEDHVLYKSLELPLVSGQEVEGAVGLEVAACSPFPREDVVWGYGADTAEGGGRLLVTAVIASRKQLASRMEATALASGLMPEAWVMAGVKSPVVLSGFGELARAAHLRIWRRVNLFLLVVTVGLLLAMALTPTLQLRARALEAQEAWGAERVRTEPLAKKRAAYLAAAGQLTELASLVQDRVDPLWAMERITQIMPDDTALLTLQVHGSKVTLTGQTGNSAALMQHLSSQPGVKDVKAPSPAVRPLGTTKDSFSIELTLLAQAPPSPSPAPAAVPAAALPPSPPLPAASSPLPAAAASKVAS